MVPRNRTAEVSNQDKHSVEFVIQQVAIFIFTKFLLINLLEKINKHPFFTEINISKTILIILYLCLYK